MDTINTRAFVIGPIGDKDAEDNSASRRSYEDAIEVFEYIIRPACTALEIEPFRADHISRAGEINDQIFRHLRDSHIVIADLTGANPNVMYELGLRHTTGKLTIQIGEKGNLPFDISTIRTIMFKRSEAGFVSAKRSLIAALAEGLEQGSDPVSATRIWLEIPEVHTARIEVTEALDDENDEPGFLEQLADMEVGFADMTQTAERGTSILEEISQILQNGAEKIQALPATGNYSTLKLAAANQTALDLQDPATRFNIVAQDYKNHVERAAPGVEYLLRSVLDDPKQLEQAPEFLDTIYAFIQASESTISGSDDFAKSMSESGNATRMMRRVTNSIRSSALSMGLTSRKIANWKGLVEQIRERL